MLQQLSFTAVLIAVAGVSAENNIATIQLREGQVFTELVRSEYSETYNATGEDMIWKFESESDSQVLIKCEDIKLTQTTSCRTSRLEINDGKNTNIYCGHHNPFKVISTSNVLTLKYSGKDIASAGYSCVVKSTKAPTAELVEVKVDEVSQLISPRKDSPYLDKVWHLECSSEYQIELTCYIDLMEGNPCYHDVLTINIGSKDGPKEYCGFRKTTHFTKSNKATVRLELDKYGEGRVSCTARPVINEENIDINMDARTLHADMDDSSEHGVKPGERNTTCPCGWANKSKKRIIQGEEASPNEFPWMVALRVFIGFFKEYSCGASIITHRHVLTAAHCVVDLYGTMKPIPPSDIQVIVGGHNLGWWPLWKSHTKHSVSMVFIRNEFLKWKTNDIAILVVKKPIQFTWKVGPICLPPNKLKLMDKRVTIMGWGKTEKGRGSTVLLKARTNVIPARNCGFMGTWEVCTRADSGSVCNGDSGGPVVWLDPETNRYTQVSVIVRGHTDCVSSGSISTKVTHFYNWIHKIINETYPEEATCAKL